MAARPKNVLFGGILLLSACSTERVSPIREQPRQPPALACAEQPLELPRPPEGRLPCELMPPTFTH